MLKESYFAVSNKLPKDAVKIYVMRARFNSILAPSWELLRKAKNEAMSFEEYRKLFIKEISENKDAIDKLFEIRETAKKRDVYLICYEKDSSKCHRSILIEIIENLWRYVYGSGRICNQCKYLNFYNYCRYFRRIYGSSRKACKFFKWWYEK
ncbi:MAG: DUF488 domain-containing protein [Candidatus Helarchaeota archaeon]